MRARGAALTAVTPRTNCSAASSTTGSSRSSSVSHPRLPCSPSLLPAKNCTATSCSHLPTSRPPQAALQLRLTNIPRRPRPEEVHPATLQVVAAHGCLLITYVRHNLTCIYYLVCQVCSGSHLLPSLPPAASSQPQHRQWGISILLAGPMEQ